MINRELCEKRTVQLSFTVYCVCTKFLVFLRPSRRAYDGTFTMQSVDYYIMQVERHGLHHPAVRDWQVWRGLITPLAVEPSKSLEESTYSFQITVDVPEP